MEVSKMTRSLIVSSLLVFVSFYNSCSNVKFKSLDIQNFSSLNNNNIDPTNNTTVIPAWNDPLLQEFKWKAEEYPFVDILFVLDESVSMSNDLENLKKGFESLTSVDFPKNVRLAFTNMAPAAVDLNEKIDFNSPLQPFYNHTSIGSIISESPGFIKLINKQNIDKFLLSHSNLSSHFMMKGCNNSWFEPSEKNETNELCFMAHSQIALQGIQYEAGTVSLFQLLHSYSFRNEKLFRDQSAVNVILISDTHDAGQGDYYGSIGAYKTMLTLEQLKEAAYENNQNIKNITFHGIVPLPISTSPLYEGLKVIGKIPLTESEANENTEGNGQRGYTYLSYIKNSFGYAIHTNNTNWDELMKNLFKETGKAQHPIIQAENNIKQINFLKVNGQSLESTQYYLRPDRKTIELYINVEWEQQLDICLEYLKEIKNDSFYHENF